MARKSKVILPTRCDRDQSIEVGPYLVKIETPPDDAMGPPWEEHDGHGIVSDWRKKGTKGPGERILCTDRFSARFYDVQASTKKAREEDWGCGKHDHKTKGEERACAVEQDFDYLRRWATDQWEWVGLVVTLLDEDGDELGQDSCWGYDSDSYDYINEDARGMLAHLIAEHRRKVARSLDRKTERAQGVR